MIFSVRKVQDSVTPQLKAIQRALSPSGRRQLLLRMARRFLVMSQSTFGGGGQAYRGNKWPAYSKSYAKKLGSTEPTLLRTGTLKGSISVGAPRANYIEVFTPVDYGAYQFLGTRRGLPARRFMPIELQGKNMWRFTARGEREMVNELSKGLAVLSNGVLPRIFMLKSRMSYEYGNPLTPPSGV